MLEAYPNDPALGCPFNGADTNYGEGSQYKRMAAIATDGTYTEGWAELLATLSLKTKTWGIYWEQPIPGAPAALGVVHGSDLIYYFPGLLGAKTSPSSLDKDLMNAVQDALINFVHFGDPNGCLSESGNGRYHWPSYGESQKVTVMNASLVAEAQPPPHRPGFDVIHKFLRPGPF
jgi:carboxylesterase type B